jgi:hypothetical protein
MPDFFHFRLETCSTQGALWLPHQPLLATFGVEEVLLVTLKNHDVLAIFKFLQADRTLQNGLFQILNSEVLRILK